MQREESVTGCGRTHGDCHQADIRLNQRHWLERQLYEVQQTPDGRWAFEPRQRLFPQSASG